MYLYLWMYGLCRVYEGVLPGNKLLGLLFASDNFTQATSHERRIYFSVQKIDPSKQTVGKNKSVGSLRFFFKIPKNVWVWVCFFCKTKLLPPNQNKLNQNSPGHHAFCSKATRHSLYGQLIGLQLSEVPTGSRTDFTFESNGLVRRVS